MRKPILTILTLVFLPFLVYAGALVIPQNTSQLPDSPGYHYVTDAQKAAISAVTNSATAAALSAVSGTNTGDETQASIMSKLGVATDNTDGYVSPTDYARWLASTMPAFGAMGGVLMLKSCPPTTQALAIAAAWGFSPAQIVCVDYLGGAYLVGTSSVIGIGSPTGHGNGTALLAGLAESEIVGNVTGTASGGTGGGSSIVLVNKYSYPSGIVATGVTVTTGDIIIFAAVNSPAMNTANPTDSQSNTYYLAKQEQNVDLDTTQCGAVVWYAVSKNDATLTITATGAGSSIVHVISGLTGSLDVENGNSESDLNTYTSHTSASISTNHANEYIFSFWFDINASLGTTMTENGTGFTKEEEQTGTYASSFDKVVSSTGSYHDATTSNNAESWGNIIVSFY